MDDRVQLRAERLTRLLAGKRGTRVKRCLRKAWMRALFAAALMSAAWAVPSAGQAVPGAPPQGGETLPDAPAATAFLSGEAIPAAFYGQVAQQAGQLSGTAEQGSAAQAGSRPSSSQSAADKSSPDASSSGSSSSDGLSQGERQRQKARRQLQEEEKQRVLGMVPNFGTTYLWDAASLSAGQKMSLAFRSAIDPFTFAAAVLVAGSHEALDDEPGFQWGAAGFGQRAGAAYLDALDGNMIGSGILPALLHQDPRYFRLGRGSFAHRLLYSIASAVVCRHDNRQRLDPNYSNIGGNLIAGAISNLYYPSQNAGVGQTIGNGMIVTAENTAGGIFDEFWPDISRKLFHKDPTQDPTRGPHPTD